MAQAAARRFFALPNVANVLEQIEHAQTQSVRDDFHGVECRIGLPGLHPTEVGLIETATLGELDLRQTRCQTQLPYALPESSCKACTHEGDCRSYASIHINTNSYKMPLWRATPTRHAFSELAIWQLEAGAVE